MLGLARCRSRQVRPAEFPPAGEFGRKVRKVRLLEKVQALVVLLKQEWTPQWAFVLGVTAAAASMAEKVVRRTRFQAQLLALAPVRLPLVGVLAAQAVVRGGVEHLWAPFSCPRPPS